MKRWNKRKRDYHEKKEIDIFLQEIINVCKKHGYSISHEDRHGAFEIDSASECNFNWLMNANDVTL